MEVKGEVEELREKRSSWMAWRWNDGLKDDSSQCCVTRDQQRERTLNSAQMCSLIHDAHVVLLCPCACWCGRVTVVRIGREEVVVVI